MCTLGPCFSLFSIKFGVIPRKYFSVSFSQCKTAMTNCLRIYCFETHQRKIMLCGTSNSSMHHHTPFSPASTLMLVFFLRLLLQESVSRGAKQIKKKISTCSVQFDPVSYISAQLISNTLTSNSIYSHN